VIEWWNNGDPASLDAPKPGLWEALHGGVELARVEVADGVLVKWARLCALSVAHLLPDGTDPVVREWLETGDPELRRAARAAAWDADARAVKRAAGAAARAAGSAAKAAESAGSAPASAAWAAWWAREAAGVARRADPALDTRAILARLIWEAHGETMSLANDRLKLGRELRSMGELEAGDAVVPPEFREGGQ
jgi:hypothetical protein